MREDRARLIAAVDVVELSQLVLAEREAVSRARWQVAAGCHEDDAEVRLPDFTGTVTDYIRHRRRGGPGGRQERWNLSAPVVHLHHDRAVVTSDGSAELVSIIGQLETTVYVALVVRAQRHHHGWRLAGLEAFLRKVDIATSTSGSWPNLPPTMIAPITISGADLNHLDPLTALDHDPEARARLRQALVWAELRPGSQESSVGPFRIP